MRLEVLKSFVGLGKVDDRRSVPSPARNDIKVPGTDKTRNHGEGEADQKNGTNMTLRISSTTKSQNVSMVII